MRKAVFESSKKKEVGVSDLTLISKITNEAINENLKKRFENAEIYVCEQAIRRPAHFTQLLNREHRPISATCSSPSTHFATVRLVLKVGEGWELIWSSGDIHRSGVGFVSRKKPT